jgi:hypothetical protein
MTNKEAHMFILIECANQEINVEKHSTLKEAQDAMRELYEEHHDKHHLGDISEYEAYLVPRTNWLVPRTSWDTIYSWKIAEV